MDNTLLLDEQLGCYGSDGAQMGELGAGLLQNIIAKGTQVIQKVAPVVSAVKTAVQNAKNPAPAPAPVLPPPPAPGMSTNMKIALGVGAAAIAGIAIYAMSKKKRGLSGAVGETIDTAVEVVDDAMKVLNGPKRRKRNKKRK
jgi:hypothetical protein